uniref:Putative reverse transcriptase-rnase h-integrase n=1 Tax=Moniliophthora roreri TaxID=221103 RepID=A0A0W0FMZ9_MONRR
MSNATSAASSSSASSSQSARVLSPVPTVSGEGRYGENITYLNGLEPNPYQLLHLFNSEHLIYPDPTPDPDIKPKIESIDSASPLQSRAPTAKVEHIPVVGGEVAPKEYEAEAEDDERENQIPENDDAQPMLRLRNPTPAPTPMTQLVDRVSALCADWSAISADIAHSTCVADASRLSLDIHLATALTNEGLAALRVERLIRAQTLCRMITIMMMSLTTISEENVETLKQEYDRDAQLLFVGADPQKAQLLSVEERLAMGWQPPSDFPPTPRLGTVDDMPDTSYNYDTELYSDGES